MNATQIEILRLLGVSGRKRLDGAAVAKLVAEGGDVLAICFATLLCLAEIYGGAAGREAAERAFDETVDEYADKILGRVTSDDSR